MKRKSQDISENDKSPQNESDSSSYPYTIKKEKRAKTNKRNKKKNKDKSIPNSSLSDIIELKEDDSNENSSEEKTQIIINENSSEKNEKDESHPKLNYKNYIKRKMSSKEESLYDCDMYMQDRDLLDGKYYESLFRLEKAYTTKKEQIDSEYKKQIKNLKTKLQKTINYFKEQHKKTLSLSKSGSIREDDIDLTKEVQHCFCGRNILDNEQGNLTGVMDSEENNAEMKSRGANDRSNYPKSKENLLSFNQKGKNYLGKKTKRNNN